MCLVGLIWFTIAIVRQRRTRRRRVQAVMLKHGRCPHCGYSLTGLPVDPGDGATVCPECAGAWRIDDPAIAREIAATPTKTSIGRNRRLIFLLIAGLAVMSLGLTFMFLRS
jgi:hypothetical protein